MSAIITARQLSHHFGEGRLQKQVLFDITLEIKTGEIVILTGPSGSGKTTLAVHSWQFPIAHAVSEAMPRTLIAHKFHFKNRQNLVSVYLKLKVLFLLSLCWLLV